MILLHLNKVETSKTTKPSTTGSRVHVTHCRLLSPLPSHTVPASRRRSSSSHCIVAHLQPVHKVMGNKGFVTGTDSSHSTFSNEYIFNDTLIKAFQCLLPSALMCKFLHKQSKLHMYVVQYSTIGSAILHPRHRRFTSDHTPISECQHGATHTYKMNNTAKS